MWRRGKASEGLRACAEIPRRGEYSLGILRGSSPPTTEFLVLDPARRRRDERPPDPAAFLREALQIATIPDMVNLCCCCCCCCFFKGIRTKGLRVSPSAGSMAKP
jgi:hypothetical protein